MAILPEITDIPSTVLSFDIKAGYNTDKMIVGVLSDATDITSFTPIDTLEVTSTNTWEHTSVNFAQYIGNGSFVALLFWSSNGNPYYFYIDNIIAESCDTRATLSLIGSNVVQVTSESGNGGFYVEYGPTGFVQGSGITEYIDITPYDMVLNYETSYDFYVKCTEDGSTCRPMQTITTMAPTAKASKPMATTPCPTTG